MIDALVIGAGPAGLMAAEMLGQAGHSVMIAEAKPSVARKLLMAGKSGLNITKSEDLDAFIASYGAGIAPLVPALKAFGPPQVMAWAEGLGQPLFTGTSQRVFPVAMKASPLLRAWMARLDGYGVTLHTRWRWTGFDGAAAMFDTPEGPKTIAARVILLALGGASWARLGSDGAWASLFAGDVAPFQPANMGFIVDWSPHMAPHFGSPVKGAALCVGPTCVRGECVISARGIEGGGIYAVSRALREGGHLSVDLLPDLDVGAVRAKLSKGRAKESMANRLRKTLGLGAEKIALVQEFCRPLPTDPGDLAAVIKSVPVRLVGPRPLDEAISTAGGLRFAALDSDLMFKRRAGVFACGEMLDWEAPTGGYLLTACLASGRWAGKAAARYLRQ